MRKFTRSQMLFEDKYTWKRDEGDSAYIGVLDRIKLDRDEGYEVLNYANKYLNTYVSLPDVNDLHKLEKLIRNILPSSTVMRDEITDFLRKNWRTVV